MRLKRLSVRVLLFLQCFPVLRFIDAQHGDEAVGLKHVGAPLAAASRCAGDLLQQPVAFPQVGTGAGLRALGRDKAGRRQAAPALVGFVWLMVAQRLRWPHAFGRTPI